jgi:hypothetical protein
MADNNKLIEQMLEHLVNDESQKAEELFHEYVVAKSREIYESLIEEEMKDDNDEEDSNDDDQKNEEFEEIAVEGDDEMDLDDADPTDDLAGDIGDEMDDEDMDDKSEEELFQDLDAIVDELQARFDSMEGDDEEMGDDEMKDSIEPELETVREYVEKVPAGHGAEKKGQAEKADGSAGGMKFSKNDMGGKAIKFGEEDGSDKGTAGGLANNKAQDMKTGNINVPGGKAGSAFSTKEPGHGAEKKGSAEDADKGAQSLFRGRR